MAISPIPLEDTTMARKTHPLDAAKTFYKGDKVLVAANGSLWRRCTYEEREAWYASDASKGMDSAGETKLPPQDTYRHDKAGEFTVVKGSCRAPRGWGNPLGGCAQVEAPDGTLWFVQRRHLATPASMKVQAPTNNPGPFDHLDEEDANAAWNAWCR